ncbi:NAD-dependent epimerase/dehydratase family protein [Rhizobium sp. FKY42]|uniref:NAD-dependent epimerase/dehydratase family protein n=1 Tax=Rhizobium sp. FKY42 TaxID=2562310 RepID=UPI0019814F96|nr:NAD-dependent epimerase/dehydratase family protein [Rhizobium sp. FKY42]
MTGANGFLGRGLADVVCKRFGTAERIVLTDLTSPMIGVGPVEMIPGDLGDPVFLHELAEPGFDIVFHLASLPGSLAEREQALGHRVNLLGPLMLAEKLAARRSDTRLVFASSIAVYGDLGQKTVTPDTPCHPQLTYGAHKLMTEIMLADMARRNVLSTISLRFPGIVARPLADNGHGSAFMSQLLHKIRTNEPFECPVPADSVCWWMSRSAAVENLIHAATLPSSGATVQPPVLHATIAEVAEAAMRVTGNRPAIHYGDDGRLRRIFGSMPPLDANLAISMGFRADADLETLVHATFSGD